LIVVEQALANDHVLVKTHCYNLHEEPPVTLIATGTTNDDADDDTVTVATNSAVEGVEETKSNDITNNADIGTSNRPSIECCLDQWQKHRQGELFLFRIQLTETQEVYGALSYLPLQDGRESKELLTEWNPHSRLMCFFEGR
jgi:hypothetical protein